MIRTLRSLLTGKPSAEHAFALQTASFSRALVVVRAFYACLLYLLLESLPSLDS